MEPIQPQTKSTAGKTTNPEANASKVGKIIYSWPALIVAIATAGPFAIPLVWKNPHYSKGVKVAITVFICGLTWWLLSFGMKMVEDLNTQMNQLQLSQ